MLNHWWLEINYGEIIYTTEIGKQYKLESLSPPLQRADLPAHHRVLYVLYNSGKEVQHFKSSSLLPPKWVFILSKRYLHQFYDTGIVLWFSFYVLGNWNDDAN
jgi:hypothetical protein